MSPWMTAPRRRSRTPLPRTPAEGVGPRSDSSDSESAIEVSVKKEGEPERRTVAPPIQAANSSKRARMTRHRISMVAPDTEVKTLPAGMCMMKNPRVMNRWLDVLMLTL